MSKAKTVKIGEVKRNPNNPRIIRDDKFKKLVQSLRDFPEMMSLRPIVVNADMIALGGNMRLAAAKEAGWKEVPVLIAEGLTLEQEREFIIKDNVGFGEWDWELLANEWDAEALGEWGLDVPVFEEQEAEAQEDDFDEEPPEVPFTVLGDLYEIGEHRLLCGDATQIESYDKLMSGELVDLLLTDPPYGIGIDGQKKSIASNPKHNRKHHEFRGWDSQRPDGATFEIILSFAEKAIIWGGNYFADLLPATRGWIYWSKGQDGLTMSDGELAWTSEDKPLRSVTVNRSALKGSVHPTQKPVEVISFCINWAGDTPSILDPFLGSGSTMVAAHQLNRKCYGMELDPKYCDVIVRRMLKLDPSLVVKRNGQPFEIKETADA